MNPRRLYRSRHDRQLAGVAGGMAEYLEIDPTIVRVLWILSVFLGGFTILLYIILAFVVPLEPEVRPAPGSWQPAPGTWQPTGGPSSDAPATGGSEGGPSTSDPDAEAEGGPTVPSAAAPAIAGWQAPSGPAWAAPAPRPGSERRPDRIGLFLGIGLVVFGAIAAIDLAVPGLAGSGVLWAGLVVALGVAMLVGSTRQRTVER